MTQWYYADRNRQQQGPVEAHELARLYRAGHLDGSSLVWRDGLAQWEALGAHLDALGPATPPPAPAAAPSALQDPDPAAAASPLDPGPAGGPVPGAAGRHDGWTLAGDSDAGASAAAATAPHAPAAAGAPAEPDPAAAVAPGFRHAGPSTPAADTWTVQEPAAYSPYAAPAATADAGWTLRQPGEVVLAGFWKRVAAYLIDSLVVGIVGGVIGVMLGMLAIPLALSGDGGGAAAVMLQVVIQLVSLGLSAAYYAGFHASRGQATLGKMAIGIKVVRTDGSRIGLLRAIGRYFAAILSGLILGIGYLMAAFTERKQGLHDMLCDTLVVDKWAFTEHPEWQRRELGTVTIVVLALWGLLAAAALVLFVAMGALLANSGSWN